MKYQPGNGAPFLNQRILKRLLIYSSRTGEWTWRSRADVRPEWNTKYAGKHAGYAYRLRDGQTYWIIRIFDYPFLAHRLAVLYIRGRWPNNKVDHRDLDGTNNRWKNLREANDYQNGHNRGRNSNNSTGFKGVSIDSKTGRFRATIQFARKWKHIGMFDTAEAAAAAYIAEAKRLAGEFARAE